MSNKLRVSLVTALIVASCGANKPAVQPPAPAPTPAAPANAMKSIEQSAPSRLILFIGDGMGVGQLTAATYAKGSPLQMLSMPQIGWTTTHEYDAVTTDSAASATALSTGRKTSYEAVSVAPGTSHDDETDPANHLETLLEHAAKLGLKTGLVATSRIVHATPAAFLGHRHARHDYEEIALDFAASDVDVLLGAGSAYFDARKDGVNLLAKFAERGYAVAKTAEEVRANQSEKLVGLMHPKEMPFVLQGERAMSLADMVDVAIETLDRGEPKGWVLVVEGSFIDWCAHALDGPCAAAETLDLDDAVGRGLDYARKREDTLVVATADHETGGLAVVNPYYSKRMTDILGGEEAANLLAAYPEIDGKRAEGTPAVQHMAIGTRKFDLVSEAPPPGIWGMEQVEDGRMTLMFGHFSVASRPFWKTPARFYAAHTPALVATAAEGPGALRAARSGDNAVLGRTLRELVDEGARGARHEVEVPTDDRPRNVILMIGDGMGSAAMAATYYHHGPLTMPTMPVEGIVATHGVDRLVNDSAAAATAMATGIRALKGSEGKAWVDGRSVAVPTIVEEAERRGIATGIVTTTPFNHATPAAFYAHVDSRKDKAGIVKSLIEFPARVPESDGIDLLLGGGREQLDDASLAALRGQGWTISESWPPDAAGRVLGVYAPDGLAPAIVRLNDEDPLTPSLAEMTSVALERLEGDEDGFLLVVEGGQIDWRLHEAKRDRSVLEEVLDYDRAVAVALEFARKRGDTLVIATADHDHTLSVLDDHYAFESGRCGVSSKCGGPFEMLPIPVAVERVEEAPGLGKPPTRAEGDAPQIFLQYAWAVQEAAARTDVSACHSANFVPLFAYGPSAGQFGGFVDQPQIGVRLMSWVASGSPAE